MKVEQEECAEDDIGGEPGADVEEVTRVEIHEDTSNEVVDKLHGNLVKVMVMTPSTVPSTPVLVAGDKIRESTPDSWSSDSSTGPDPLGTPYDDPKPDPTTLKPLFHVRIERNIPHCETCKCRGLIFLSFCIS